MTHLSFLSACLPAVIGLCLVSPQAQSAEPDETKKWTATKMFEKKDADGDGFLTLDELKKGMKGKQLEGAEKRFKRLDADGDGKVSLEELKAGFAAGGQKKKKD